MVPNRAKHHLYLVFKVTSLISGNNNFVNARTQAEHKPGLQWAKICLVTYHQPAGIIPTMSCFPCPLKDAPWLLFS